MIVNLFLLLCLLQPSLFTVVMGNVTPCGFAAETIGFTMKNILEDIIDHILEDDLERVKCEVSSGSRRAAEIHYRRNGDSILYTLQHNDFDDDWGVNTFDASHNPFGSFTYHSTGIETVEEFEACLDMVSYACFVLDQMENQLRQAIRLYPEQ